LWQASKQASKQKGSMHCGKQASKQALPSKVKLARQLVISSRAPRRARGILFDVAQHAEFSEDGKVHFAKLNTIKRLFGEVFGDNNF
jgi:hypothetical protein